jgi:hypothetical protein
MNSNIGKPITPYLPRQANVYEDHELVDVDDIIDHAMLIHEAIIEDDDDKQITSNGDGSLIYMADCSPSAGDIRKQV